MVLNKFWMRHRRLIFILILFVAPLIPLFMLRVSLPRLHVLDRVSSWVVHPTAEAGRNLVTGVGVLWSRYIALVDTAEEIEKLKKENLDLENTILQYKEMEAENSRLKELLSMPVLPKSKVVAGKIIGQDTTPESMSFFVNVGSEQGIKPRMPVVTAQGIVGTISRVYRNSSLFISIADPSHDVDGIVVRSRARFIVEGRGRSLLGRLKYLDRAEDIRVGDSVVTSGLDGVFPKGLKIGDIVRVERPRTGVTQEAELRTAVDFGSLEEVLVLESGGIPGALDDFDVPRPAGEPSAAL
jgi:rod shape-determining protein MreC